MSIESCGISHADCVTEGHAHVEIEKVEARAERYRKALEEILSRRRRPDCKWCVLRNEIARRALEGK